MLDALYVALLHEHATAHWHDASTPISPPRNPLETLIIEQHRANFDLWHCEDGARDPSAPDHTIVELKHSIDHLNQQRNDLAERIDLTLLDLAPAQPDTAPLHSETPGLMIDRLSIIALKIFHTAEETHRASANAAHHERNQTRLAQLTAQRDDLTSCLAELWSEVLTGKRRFKLYRQLKMYNDPDLNPVLYSGPSTTRS
jgi:hypothetical protein